MSKITCPKCGEVVGDSETIFMSDKDQDKAKESGKLHGDPFFVVE